MFCVLRVAGTRVEIDRILSTTKIQPFRIDRIGIDSAHENSLHYDVTVDDANSQAELISDITRFLAENADDLSVIRQSKPEKFSLDVALIVAPEMASLTLQLNNALLAATVEAGLSYTISVYR